MVCLRKGEKSLREEKSVCGKGKDLLTQMSKCAYGSPEVSYAETKRFTTQIFESGCGKQEFDLGKEK